MRWVRVLLPLAAIALWPLFVSAVAVAPHAVFIDHRTRTAEVILQAGTEAEEIAIDLQYGYPATDTAGGIYIHFPDTLAPADRSAASWIRAFPRRLRLEPNQRQIVRLLASPPADIADGEYWSRLIVTARGATVPVAGADSNVQVGLDLVTRTIISIAYRKGAVTTGVHASDFRATIVGDSLIAWVGLARQGNAAYLGTGTFALLDGNDRPARQFSTPIAVYHALRRRYAFPLDGLASGSYTAVFELATTRDDLADRYVLSGNTVRRSAAVAVP